MQKKIIFMIINMNVGGTEKALLNMISEIPKDKYDITILMLEEYGGFLNSVPNGVHIEYLSGYKNIKNVLNDSPQIISLDLLKKGKMVTAFNIIFLHLISKVIKDRSIFFKYILNDYPLINHEFDVAVAYAGPMDFISYYVATKIKAKKKIQWVHFDITKIEFNKNFASKIYHKFDKIFVVSNEGKNKFINTLPNFKNKTDEFTNIVSSEFVVKMADKGAGFDDDFKGVRILTVGRLSKEKGQDLTIPVLAKLKEDGYNVRWYCIGDGSARVEYEQLIKEYGIENDYILLGTNPNPYPFMKHCDIYVQSSRHEGYCITLSEARCFDNPIISTNFTGASEQISHDQTGLIVNFDEKQMYNAIRRLLDDVKLKDSLKKNLQNEIVDTTIEIEKFYKIINSIH
ncbi:glycosyltransferase [Bacillus sp. V33-4]|uniref:glycosyltransferase n=1 Tax=Bacillus sp. V33-4 TaxID=2054169 RepID=UPI000C777DD0|nr:glycosyltransferase [Bacillus sp. V33-4]PLR87259.1 glycosyltransferase [Bacillus sp. V33-4]